MKKLLLLLSVAMLSLGMTAQINPTRFDKTVNQSTNRLLQKKAPAANAGESGFNLQFCGDIASWFIMLPQNKVDYKCYLYITPEMATMIAGNKIVDISFSCATSFGTGRDGQVFVTESLEGEPLVSQDCKVENGLNLPTYYQTVSLDNPYTIKENTGFYFGYVVKQCRFSQIMGADYPVGIDGLAPNGYSGFVELTDATTGKVLAVVDMDKDMGTDATNLFLAAKTVGESKGFENVFQIGSMKLCDFTLPVLDTKNSEYIGVAVRNIGGNALTTVEYSFDINGVKGEAQTCNVSIAPYEDSYLKIPAPELVDGRNNITLNIISVNGVPAATSSSVACVVLRNGGYDRKFVVEEGTGTWCGYCPRGIVGMETMSTRYPDKFIGIAVHSGDKMAVTSYNSLINAYFEGFPSCIVNRDPIYLIDPELGMLEYCKDYWADQAALGKVDLAVETDGTDLKVKSYTTFAYDEANADYKLAFVILEDDIVGAQTNYYTGHPGTLEWWDEQGSTVQWTYKDTARDIFNWNGLANSVPKTITAGQPMEYTATLTSKNIGDITKTSVVALLLDGKTGTIINAAKVTAADYGNDSSGISSTLDNSNAPAEYFGINGVRLEQPVKGNVVLMRKGGKVTKVIY